MNNNRRNIGVFAHVDAGKTTLSERLLLISGAIRKAGSVDEGSAHTDRMEVERRRGISVKAACARFLWKDTEIRLIDTPGHTDFSSEVERGFWAIDGAILLISGVDGVEPRTEALFSALRRHRIPTFMFVNKMDRATADFPRALLQIRQTLNESAFDWKNDEALMAAISEIDDQALSDYLDGKIYPRAEMLARAIPLLSDAQIYPVLKGSALTGEGVDALLDAMLCLPAPQGGDASPLCGIVFALEADTGMGRGAYVRLYSGCLKNRDALLLAQTRATEYAVNEKSVTSKITQIRALSVDGRGTDVGVLRAGDIGVVYGFENACTGQVLGDRALLPPKVKPEEMRAPLLMVKVDTEQPDQRPALYAALAELTAEDPLLDLRMYGASPHIRAMGLIQLEIIAEQLRTRFGQDARFGEAEIVYRETIARPAVGFVAYTMPKPCWAVIRFEIEPGPRGSGITYESVVSPRDIKERYQHQIEQALPAALRQGMLGWQVDDVHIRLTGGEDHPIHTHPLDFIVATPMALMDGLRRGGSVLLEPILSLEITVPESAAGRVGSLIRARRGNVAETRYSGETDISARMLCEVPAATGMDLSVELSRLTSGRGALSASLKGYRECEQSLGKTCPRRGINPLDTAKYILAARNALESDIYD